MQLDVVLEKETIDTLETIVRNRLEAYQKYCAGGGAVVEECGKVDNSDSFFPLVRSKGFWVTSISLQDINQNWERNDNIWNNVRDYVLEINMKHNKLFSKKLVSFVEINAGKFGDGNG